MGTLIQNSEKYILEASIDNNEVEWGCLVSVVIPVYNVLPYISEALESVVVQTYEKLEIIIIDDGSTDGSELICNEYAKKDTRIRIFHQENRGLSAARNAGLDIMNGKVVAFLDADDAYHPKFIETMMVTMIEKKVDIVSCKYYNYQHSTIKSKWEVIKKAMPIAEQGEYSRNDALRALADGRLFVSVWNKIYRKGLWKDIRFPEGHVYEDLFTTYQIIDFCNKVYVLDYPLYLHRKREGSITSCQTWKSIKDKYLACIHLDKYFEKRTPCVFSNDQLFSRLSSTLDVMIGLYLNKPKDSIEEDDITEEYLKTQIKRRVKEVRIENCSYRTRIAYEMLLRCPDLLRFLYSIRQYVRGFRKRTNAKKDWDRYSFGFIAKKV